MAEMRVLSFADARILEPPSSLRKAQILVEARRSPSGKTVFLSHSSKDDGLVPAVIALLEQHGGTVYADDFDKRLPDPPNPVTAVVLRGEICGCPRLVVLATDNSYSSRWIPWELGLGDGLHDIHPNAVLPASPNGRPPSWLETQYFHLYPKIVSFDNEWFVMDPMSVSRWRLREWLTTRLQRRAP